MPTGDLLPGGTPVPAKPELDREPARFDICGPLPGPGVSVLEASAGTGKTYTLAALVTRMIAEGVVELPGALVVTFTRMATGELRDRARGRLASTEASLRGYLGDGELSPDDELARLLASGCRAEVAERQGRLAAALSNFDSATITTTHGFCHMVLSELGVWGEVAPGAALLEDATDMLEEVVDDLCARYALASGRTGRPSALPFGRKEAGLLAAKAVGNPGTELAIPVDPADSSEPGLRTRFAHGVRVEMERRLRAANLLTYDDVLVRLAKALADPVRGPAARARLRKQYQVVLVDEFQDTDQVQWDVVRQAFADGTTRLVLIGDPKQAVYAFRGADVYAYLRAARSAHQRFTLDDNWRSDAQLLAAYDAMLQPLRLGHPEIVYRPARPGARREGSALAGFPVNVPLRARLVERSAPGLTRTKTGLPQKGSATKWVAEDLARDIAALLSSGARLIDDGDCNSYGDGHSDGDGGAGRAATGGGSPGGRPVGPEDIGVLVGTNLQAEVVQAALRAAGVPVAVSGADSVLATPAASDWAVLLSALEQPASRSLAVAVALTPFFGKGADELARGDEALWEGVHGRLHEWSALVRHAGTAALFGKVCAEEDLPARLLAELEGERRLTDLGHVAELLHAEEVRSHLGLAALRGWLSRRGAGRAGGDGSPSGTSSVPGGAAAARSRRLDSGLAAVQVMTVHRAKGLEFPVVYCPFLWDNGRGEVMGGPVVFHDGADDDKRKLDVGCKGPLPSYKQHFLTAQAEGRGEALRQMYVALTRARHQLVLWWVEVHDCQHSALGRTLLCRDARGEVAPRGWAKAPESAQVRAAFQKIARKEPNLVSVEPAVWAPAQRWERRAVGDGLPPMATASFDRELDLDWRRSSYTSLTAGAHAGSPALEMVGTEPESLGTADEPSPAQAVASRATGAAYEGPEEEVSQRAVPSLLGEMAAGPEAGTFVHGVLEAVDFAALDLRAALEVAVGERLALYPGPEADLGMLVEGLDAVLSTPLGPAVDGARLRDVSCSDRLDELRFELPLAGGDNPCADVAMSDLAALFEEYSEQIPPLGSYAAALAVPELSSVLRGYLTGSLDLVVRRLDAAGRQRFFVVDYKTNRLGAPGEGLSAWHYRQAALEAEMCRCHYPLQATLYLVALHRYLRWRLPGYDPGTALGGALYLFVRGMVGPGTPAPGGRPCGVFTWSPPASFVVAVSDLLSGTRSSHADRPGTRPPSKRPPGKQPPGTALPGPELAGAPAVAGRATGPVTATAWRPTSGGH